MNKKLFQKSNRIERITFIFDFLAIAAYLALFFILFGMLELPEIINGRMDLDNLQYMLPTYEFLSATFDKWQMNTMISLVILFALVAIPMMFINVKKLRNRTIYEINSYTASSKFVQALVNLLSFNPISAGLRIYNMFVLVKFVKGYNAKEFFKSIGPAVKKFSKELFKKKEIKNKEELDEYSISIKQSIRRQNASKIIRMSLTYIFLIIMAFIIIIPFYWMVLTSLKDFTGATSNNPEFFIGISRMNWVNYKVVLTELNFGLYIRNTIFIALMSTLGTVITTILAAYAFARIEFKGRELLFSILIMTMMIPGELYIITNLITVSRNGFGWVGMPTGENNYFLAMILPFVTSISYIFFLRQSFKQIPDSLYKAARVDGCSDFKFLTRVMVPIASPTIFTITILNVFGSWNAYIWPRIITGLGGEEGQNYWLISNALRDTSFVQENGKVMYNLQIAASALVTVPLLIVFFMFKKYIMNGIGRSGTKG
ncbi:carbohydrate ABC transporter permease [Candidatus Izemoplasma sp. B36]|uniref:carbohydrate ABC transporter permease n=1 Tax=Candidatus Izemoplasma sp. B36 TaxID=3242468 RepID=UPI003557AD45